MHKKLEFIARAADFASSNPTMDEVGLFLVDNKNLVRSLPIAPGSEYIDTLEEFRRKYAENREEDYGLTRRSFLAGFFNVVAALGVASCGFSPRVGKSFLPYLTEISDHPVFGRNIGWGRDGEGHLNAGHNIPGIDFPANNEIIISVASGHVFGGSPYPYDIAMTHNVVGGSVKSAYLEAAEKPS